MADYCALQDVKLQIGGVWGPDLSLGFGLTRDTALAQLITSTSRMFDRATARPTNWWQSAPGTTRSYSGTGDQWLDVDEWDAITAVTLSTRQDRSDAITLSLVPGTTDYVAFEPTSGPPYSRLFLLRGWLPDVYNVGNVRVTGTPTLPAEIKDAVAIWTAYRWLRRESGLSDTVQRAGAVTSQPYNGDLPPEVQQVINYYREQHGPSIALVGGDAPRISPWLGWQAYP